VNSLGKGSSPSTNGSSESVTSSMLMNISLEKGEGERYGVSNFVNRPIDSSLCEALPQSRLDKQQKWQSKPVRSRATPINAKNLAKCGGRHINHRVHTSLSD